MKRVTVELTQVECKQLHALRTKGEHLAREVRRAHILAALNQGVGDAQIMQVLGVSHAVLWRTRAAYHEGGLDYALRDLPRPGAPRQYFPEQEAEVVALACKKPSAGRKRWTVAGELAIWQEQRNAQKQGINWGFSRADADRKLGHNYIT